MRFLQRHAELITTICVLLSLALSGALYWISQKNANVVQVETTAPAQSYAAPEPAPASASEPQASAEE